MHKLALLLSLSALSFCAETGGDNPMSKAIKTQFTTAKTNLSKAAEKMPEESYSFKPSPDVRSFGQLVGHVANASYYFCSAAQGEKSPSAADIEKTVTAKADLVKALNDAFAYCDKAYNSLTDATAPDKLKFGQNETARIGILSFNSMHDYEHYGNMVTYMRLKNIVPPSSEPKK
jgi:uncharacterized damage-inducible protein DinB